MLSPKIPFVYGNICALQKAVGTTSYGDGERQGQVFPGISAPHNTRGELDVYTYSAIRALAPSHQLHTKCLFYRQTGRSASPAPLKVCVEKKSLFPTGYCLSRTSAVALSMFWWYLQNLSWLRLAPQEAHKDRQWSESRLHVNLLSSSHDFFPSHLFFLTFPQRKK